jgi:hypothetical protein
MPHEYDVKKICGFWRIYIERAWRGTFTNEQDALDIASQKPCDYQELKHLIWYKKQYGVWWG